MLLTGAILAPGQRTVTSILRITGLARERRFVNYHRVLSRAAWCPRAASRVLLGLLVAVFAPKGPVVLGIDDIIERRRGKRIAAPRAAPPPAPSETDRKGDGIYRDPVRSSRGHFVKASGLRWLSLMLLAPVPWAKRVLALPFLTALAPSGRYCQTRGRRHKTLTDWGRQLVLQARRWLPGRELAVVADSVFATLEFLAAVIRRRVAVITRLRLDAALYDTAPPRRPGTVGRPRTIATWRSVCEAASGGATGGASAWRTHPKCWPTRPRCVSFADIPPGERKRWQRITVPGWRSGGERAIEISTNTAVWRYGEPIPQRDVSEADRGGMPVIPVRWVLVRDPLGKFDLQALLCTDPAQDPIQVLRWFVQRWQVEVPFCEVRDHLGVKTQCQWSDKAIARTTPCLLSLFSLVTLLGRKLTLQARQATATSAWHHKQRPTFSDTLAAVRRDIWREQGFVKSNSAVNMKKLRPALRNAITYALCQAA